MSCLSRHPLIPTLAAAIAFGLLLAAGATSFAIAIAPTLLLLAHLAVGRFPAESLLERLAARVSRRGQEPEPGWRAPRPRPSGAFGPRGGRLIAARLSGRAPPLGA